MVSMIFVYDAAAQKFESSNPTAHVVPPGTALNEMCHLLIKRQSKWRCVHINLKYSELFEKFTMLSLNAATWMWRSIMKHTKWHAKKYRSFSPFYYLLQGRSCFIVRWSFFYLLFLYHFRVLQPNSNAFNYQTTAIRFTGRLFFSF